MLNVAFSELKMKKGKVVLTNRGSIGIYGKQIKQDKAVKEKMIEVLTERANAYKA